MKTIAHNSLKVGQVSPKPPHRVSLSSSFTYYLLLITYYCSPSLPLSAPPRLRVSSSSSSRTLPLITYYLLLITCFLLSLPLSAQIILHPIRQPNDRLDLSTQQECDIAITRGITWLQAQTNTTADAQAYSQAIIALLNSPAVTPPVTNQTRQQTAQQTINQQRRDPTTGGGYWHGTNNTPSIQATIQALITLKNL